MSLDKFLEKEIIVTQVRSNSGLQRKQKACLLGLGLGKINSSSKLLCSSSVLGMVRKVEHLLKVSEA